MSTGRVQTKAVSSVLILASIASRPDGKTHRHHLLDDLDEYPWKVVISKLKSMERQGLISNGCTDCDCSAFLLTNEGKRVALHAMEHTL